MNTKNKDLTIILLGEISLQATERVTGSGEYASHLLGAFRALDDVQLHVITLGEEDNQAYENNLTFHTIRRRRFIPFPASHPAFEFLHPVALIRMQRLIRRLNPDVIHVISTALPYSTIGAFLSTRYPAILTAFGLSAMEIPYKHADYTMKMKLLSTVFSPISLMNERFVIARIPHLIVDTESIKEMISPWTASTISVVPAGIDLDAFDGSRRANQKEGEPDIFFVNNLRWLKGADILIRAVQSVRNELPEIKVCIAGSGPQMESLTQLVNDLSLQQNIILSGFVSNKKKRELYENAKMVVIPSRWDCQPLVLFEAAAAGKPVIASDSSNPGIVIDGETGFVFESENYEALADKIIHLLHDDELRMRMAKKTRELAYQYDWSNVARVYMRIYHDAIKTFP